MPSSQTEELQWLRRELVLSEKLRTSLISQLRGSTSDEQDRQAARPFTVEHTTAAAAAAAPQAGVQVWHLQEVCDLAESALAKMQLRRMGCVLERSSSRDAPSTGEPVPRHMSLRCLWGVKNSPGAHHLPVSRPTIRVHH